MVVAEIEACRPFKAGCLYRRAAEREFPAFPYVLICVDQDGLVAAGIGYGQIGEVVELEVAEVSTVKVDPVLEKTHGDPRFPGAGRRRRQVGRDQLVAPREGGHIV